MRDIPVLILIFNRPSHTRHLINSLKKIKPKIIYVFSDGVRKNHLSDLENCKKSKLEIDKIKWKCVLRKKYLNSNLGCRFAVSKGISWFFKNETKGIILEDDCIPSKYFFEFCEWSLKKFKNNKKIGTVTGNNFLRSKINIKSSFYFSKYAHCWGWATWKDRWNLYNKNIGFWSKWKNTTAFDQLFNNKNEKKYWIKIFNMVSKNQIDSWAYPWNLCLWYKKKIIITPKFNLVKNIGYGKSATHTFNKNENLIYSIKKLKKPYIFPKNMKINSFADDYVFKNHLKGLNFLWPNRLFFLIKTVLTNPYFVIFKLKNKI